MTKKRNHQKFYKLPNGEMMSVKELMEKVPGLDYDGAYQRIWKCVNGKITMRRLMSKTIEPATRGRTWKVGGMCLNLKEYSEMRKQRGLPVLSATAMRHKLHMVADGKRDVGFLWDEFTQEKKYKLPDGRVVTSEEVMKRHKVKVGVAYNRIRAVMREEIPPDYLFEETELTPAKWRLKNGIARSIYSGGSFDDSEIGELPPRKSIDDISGIGSVERKKKHWTDDRFVELDDGTAVLKSEYDWYNKMPESVDD